jgi:hypothetical protein
MCECGRKKDTMPCWKREKEWDRLVTYLKNLELRRLREEQLFGEEGSVNLGEIDEEAVFTEIKEKTPKASV